MPLKVGFDQTIWSGLWNSIYYATLGVLRMEDPRAIWKELKETFIPLLTVSRPYFGTQGFDSLKYEALLGWLEAVAFCTYNYLWSCSCRAKTSLGRYGGTHMGDHSVIVSERM